MYKNTVQIKGLKTETLITIVILLLSSGILFGWLFNIREILNAFSNTTTINFNVALLFFLSGISILVSSKLTQLSSVIYITASSLILLISLLTVFQYNFKLNYEIDNFFIHNKYSSSYSGRMSETTAFCFLLTGFSLLGMHSKNNFYKRSVQYLLLIVALISFISLTTHILQIPIENKTFFLSSMAIPTSILFLALSYTISKKKYSRGYTGLLNGNYTGSKLLRLILPFVITLPLILSYLLLTYYKKGIIEADFGVILYTFALIVMTLIYISFISVKLNNADTERNELEKLLMTTNQELNQFKYALDESSIVAITDSKGIITYVNDTFCEISQYSKKELIGNTHKIINSGHHPKSFFKDLWKTIGKGNVWVGEIKNKAKDGTFYWVFTSIVPFKNAEGKIYQYLAIRQDVTDRKKAELLSQQNTEKVKEKNKELEQFAYIASHDLQEPLRTVTSFAGLLEEEYSDKLDGNASQYLEFITQASKRMSELVKGLLDYSRIGKGREKVIVDCNEVVNDIQQDLSVIITETKAKIKVENLPTICAYNTELRLLFQNLISNAIKFRKKDQVSVVKISAKKKKDHYHFLIEDNGIGIANEHLEKIFIIFQRLHNKHEYDGSGIGLAHCRKIIALHEGEIWVESELERGSNFHFTIPY